MTPRNAHLSAAHQREAIRLLDVGADSRAHEIILVEALELIVPDRLCGLGETVLA